MLRSALLGIGLALLVAELSAQPITYDQRQQGRVNVQVDVKDLQIVAIVGSDTLDDFNYDYAYDYADFTVKPNTKPTTTKVPAITTKATPLEISSSVSPFEWFSSSTALGFPTSKAPEEPLIKATKAPEVHPTTSSSSVSTDSSSVPTEIKVSENATKAVEDNSSPTSVEVTVESTSASSTETSSKRPLGTAEPRKRCPAGFQMRSGRCFKRRHSLISPRLALMKLAPTLLAKSQLFSELAQATTTTLTDGSSL